MELRIAIISDLHCHHSSNGTADSLLLTDLPRRPNAQHPVSAFQDLVRAQRIASDLVLAPGDLANRADPQGIASGWAFVQELRDALRAPTLVPTLGNHDVVSRDQVDDPFHLAKGLYPEFPGLGDAIATKFWAHGFCIIEAPDCLILLINSAACHNNPASSKRGLVSTQQLSDLERELGAVGSKPFQVAVCHHHPILHEDLGLGTTDVMENGGLLVELLSEYHFNLIVHGHKHHPKLSYAGNARGLPVLASGSFAAGMKNGLATRTRNVFHLVTLRRESTDSPCFGIVHTWQFQHSKGWTPASCSAADFPHITGFGCYVPADTLALRVLDEFRAYGKALVNWTEIVEKVPELQFIPPAVFIALGKRLREQNVTLYPEAPDVPTFIGVPI